MRWEKMGLVFVPDGTIPWMRTHASNPVAEHRHDDCFRIYFGSRDDTNRTSIGFIDLELLPSPKVVAVHSRPILEPGELGMFDDSGMSMGCLIRVGGKRYLYYVGWNLGVTVPWRNSIGMAVSAGPDEPFIKYSRAPIVDRSEVDPFSLSYPWVLEDGGEYRMWYGSNLVWGKQHADMHHVIKRAVSSDGIHWSRDGSIAIDLCLPKVWAVCRPCVVKEGPVYHMWYCYRGDAYRIGYARSHDGSHWEKMPDPIAASTEGWDSEMIAYPHVFTHRGDRYILYNGNRYGLTGFGIARQI
jgi:predicted GH43/DUF377 family glycosyl hydrolase